MTPLWKKDERRHVEPHPYAFLRQYERKGIEDCLKMIRSLTKASKALPSMISSCESRCT